MIGSITKLAGEGARCKSRNSVAETRKRQVFYRTNAYFDLLQVYMGRASARAQLDEDLPAHGAYYCTPCARYFVTDAALTLHTRTKPHKRRRAAGTTADSQFDPHTPCCARVLLTSRKRQGVARYVLLKLYRAD